MWFFIFIFKVLPLSGYLLTFYNAHVNANKNTLGAKNNVFNP